MLQGPCELLEEGCLVVSSEDEGEMFTSFHNFSLPLFKHRYDDIYEFSADRMINFPQSPQLFFHICEICYTFFNICFFTFVTSVSLLARFIRHFHVQLLYSATFVSSFPVSCFCFWTPFATRCWMTTYCIVAILYTWTCKITSANLTTLHQNACVK